MDEHIGNCIQMLILFSYDKRKPYVLRMCITILRNGDAFLLELALGKSRTGPHFQDKAGFLRIHQQ
jgi:hypothetical protein